MPEPDELEEIGTLHLLAPGEEVRAWVRTTRGRLDVTNRRLLVTEASRIALDLPIEKLRRIEFDIERSKPATLVIVAAETRYDVQELVVPTSQLNRAGQVLALVAERLTQLSA